VGSPVHAWDMWLDGRPLYPSPAGRARLVVLDDAELSNAEVALRARCTAAQAQNVRRRLVSYGVLAPRRPAQAAERGTSPACLLRAAQGSDL